MTHDLAIAGCGRCPFAGREEPGIWLPVCKAALYLDRENRQWYRPFEVRDRGEWVFPSPPPDWCPLRAGAVIVRVAAADVPLGLALLPAATDPANPPPRLDLQRRRMTRCQSDDDGYCDWPHCPQERDGEKATGRHCPLDVEEGEDHDG
jgi:hypothetical protein